MEFIEAIAFTKYVYNYLTDDEFLGLQGFLLKYPEFGKIVPVQAVSENFAGAPREKARAAECV